MSPDSKAFATYADIAVKIQGSAAEIGYGAHRIQAIAGKNGGRSDKEEGDHATPLGRFPLRRVFYRADRVASPETRLPVNALSPQDGWCDDPNSPDYNSFVTQPYHYSHEKLWRDDHIYDIIVVIGYNDDPPIVKRGSAIFLHLQRTDGQPTEGCLAMSEQDLRKLLSRCDTTTHLHITV